MSMVVVGVVGAVGSVVGGIFGRKAAKRAAREAAKRRAKLQAKMAQLEASRQEIINPYEGVKDLTSMISNPFAQLSVATKAAEIQIEEADISLANTLDTMRATGASAGGATALANAALRSKRGVAASIEQQEKSNEDKRAAGEQAAQNKKQQEQQRMQTADVAGRQFVFNQTESREMQQLNRVAGQLGAAQQAVSQANSDATAATLGMIGGITSSISSAASAYKA
jgi:chromosome segregation ATPase